MRIVIVEDELQIRNGLVKLVERINSTYHVVGCAVNGLQGLSCIKEQQPDVVITDVRMPEMDGLEMIGAVKAAGISTHFLIMSAYSDFTYAKTALTLGVSDYLLKPASIEELSQALKKMELQIKESAAFSEINSFESAIRYLILNDGNIDKQTQKHIADKFQLGEDENFTEVLFYFGQHYSMARDSVSRLTCQNFQRECSVVCSIPLESKKSILYVLSGVKDKAKFTKWLQSSVKIHSQTIWTGADVSLAFCTGYNELYSTAMGLLDALIWKISLPNEPLIIWPDVLQTQTQHCSFPIEIENQLRIAICSHSFSKINTEFQRFIDYFSGDTVYLPIEIRECYTRFLWTTLNLSKEVGLTNVNKIKSQKVMEELLDTHNITEINNVATKMLNILCTSTEQRDIQELNIIILKAKSLIHEFYSSGINLEEIAQKLNITPEYLSAQFHQVVGETFSTYIRNYRISKAKELLLGTQLKLNQIAMKVGYSDPKYFSQVFKKVTGQLPGEYRRAK